MVLGGLTERLCIWVRRSTIRPCHLMYYVHDYYVTDPQELHDENESHTNDKCDTNVVITIALGCLLAVVVTGCITLAVLQFTKNRKG